MATLSVVEGCEYGLGSELHNINIQMAPGYFQERWISYRKYVYVTIDIKTTEEDKQREREETNMRIKRTNSTNEGRVII